MPHTTFSLSIQRLSSSESVVPTQHCNTNVHYESFPLKIDKIQYLQYHGTGDPDEASGNHGGIIEDEIN